MATIVTYKDNTLTTLSNGDTKTLKTAGTYLEDDIEISENIDLQNLTVTPNTSTQIFNTQEKTVVFSNNSYTNSRAYAWFGMAVSPSLEANVLYNVVFTYTDNQKNVTYTVDEDIYVSNYGYMNTGHTYGFALSTNQISFYNSTNNSAQSYTVTNLIISKYNTSIVKNTYLENDNILFYVNINLHDTWYGSTVMPKHGYYVGTVVRTTGTQVETFNFTNPDNTYQYRLIATITDNNITTEGFAKPSGSANYIAEANWEIGTSDQLYDKIVSYSVIKNLPDGWNEVTVNPIPSNYVIPTGTLNISANGTYDVSSYASAEVAVAGGANLQAKTVTPTTSNQTVTADSGYDGLSTVTVSAMPTGTATAPTSISGTAATVSTGTNTLTLTKSVSVTPRVTTAGYVSAGTAGNSSVSLTANVTTKAAATITPSTSNQTIAANTYLTGTQTIAGDANLVGSNILSGVSIFGVPGTVNVVSYRSGTAAPASSLGSDGDIYLQLAQ